MKALKSPIVVSNIDDSLEPTFQGLYNKSTVIERNGKKIGIIGVLVSTVKVTMFQTVSQPQISAILREDNKFFNFFIGNCRYRKFELLPRIT